jgi:hypothetical protein
LMAAGVAAAAGAGTAAGEAATADVDDGFVLMTGGSGAEEEGEELEGEATERAGEPDAEACMDALLPRRDGHAEYRRVSKPTTTATTAPIVKLRYSIGTSE